MRGARVLQIHLLCARFSLQSPFWLPAEPALTIQKLDAVQGRFLCSLTLRTFRVLFLILQIKETARTKGMTGSRWWLKSVQCLLCLPHYQWDFSTQAASQNSWAICDPKNQGVPPAVSLREFLGCCGFHSVKGWALVQLAQGMCLAVIPGIKVRGKQRVMMWKEPHSKSRSLVGRGDWVRKRAEGTKVSVTHLFIYLFSKNVVKVR